MAVASIPWQSVMADIHDELALSELLNSLESALTALAHFIRERMEPVNLHDINDEAVDVGLVLPERIDRALHLGHARWRMQTPPNPPLKLSVKEDVVDLKANPKSPKAGEREFPCAFPGCSVNQNVFTSRRQLARHFTAEHARDSDLAYPCPECDRKFVNAGLRQRHVAKKHVKNHVCDVCGHRFNEKSRLLQHRRIHTGEKPFACPHCSFRCNAKKNLDAHKRAKHADFGQASHFCEVCGIPFQTSYALDYHVQRKHVTPSSSGRARLQCPLCPFATSNATQFRQHVDYQCQFDGVKACLCNICGKAMKTPTTLKLHVKTMHAAKAEETFKEVDA